MKNGIYSIQQNEVLEIRAFVPLDWVSQAKQF